MKFKKITKKIALVSALATVTLTSGSVLGTAVYAEEGVGESNETTDLIIDSEKNEAVDSDIDKQETKVTDDDSLNEKESKDNPDIKESEKSVSETEKVKETENTDKKQVTDTMKAKDTSAKTEEKKLNGWQTISGKKYYYKDGIKQTGWLRLDNVWYYLGTDGIMRTGWQEMGQGTSNPDGKNKKHWSYFGDDGKLREGWQEMGQGTNNPDGKNPKHWSYFGPNGWLREGWQQLGQGTNNPDGKNPKHWSYFGPNGWLREGWKEMGQGTNNPDGNHKKHWSYFGPNGWLREGWQQMGKGTANPDGNNEKHWSYFGTNGWLREGWQEMGLGTNNPDGKHPFHWSYFGPNGWLREGWQKMGQGTDNPDQDEPVHYSYFGTNGWLTVGTKKIDGKNYTFDSKGWLIVGSVSLGNEKEEGQLIADGCYNIASSKNTNYVLDVANGATANGTAIQSWSKNGSVAQMFQIKHLGNNIYTIRTASTIYGSALDIPGGSVKSGAKIQQYSYNGSNGQKWKVVSAGNGSYTFKTVTGNMVLDIDGGKLEGGKLQLASPKNSDTQKFKLSKASGFLFRNGRKYYFNSNGDRPMIGIDVSAWSENIDWEKVKADGIEFAIIRTAHRLGRIDPYGERNMRECTRLGIPFGVYCYSYATTNDEADYEVDVLLKTLKNYNPQLGVFVDVEDNDTYSAAFGNIYAPYARRKITDICKRMVNRIQAAGYLAGVYANEVYLNNILYLDEMPNARWVARYYNNNAYDRNIINLSNKGYKIWQFTSTGTIKGVPNNGDVDLNTLIEKYW